jgi:hypothetical protein
VREDLVNPEGMESLGTLGIPGERLVTPRPGTTYNVFQFRDGDTLVLRVTELLSDRPGGTGPVPIGDLRVNRGGLPRVLDVVREVANALGIATEMRDRLNNLEKSIPEDFMERY